MNHEVTAMQPLGSLSRHLLRLVLVICIAPICASSQTPPSPTPSAFRASVIRMQKQLPEWERTLQDIKVEQLPIGYAHGTIVEKARMQGLQWIQMTGIAADQALRTDSLALQINLAYIINELEHSLSDLSSLLANVDIPKGSIQAQRDRWAAELQDLSSGPVNKMSQDAISFAMDRADNLQKQLQRQESRRR